MNDPRDRTEAKGLRGRWLNLGGGSWYLTIARSSPAGS